jgi:hypothetical protein
MSFGSGLGTPASERNFPDLLKVPPELSTNRMTQ